MEKPQQSLDERLLESAIGALEIFGIYLGRRLGLYDALAAGGSTDESKLAEEAGISKRYAREWLEQQAAAGYITVAEPSPDPATRRYSLTDEQLAVLVEQDNPVHLSPLALAIVGVARTLPKVAAAYRSGAGVGFAEFGADLRDGQGGINRPAFTHDLVDSWLPATRGVHDRLSTPGSKVADLGCGQGWAAIAVARAYPDATVVGLDSDEASIADAVKNSADHGVEVRFEHADATALSDVGPFDLVLLLEVLHDLAHPVEVLSAVRRSLAPDGVLLVADERVGDQFSAPSDQLEQMMYGWSISHCLPSSMAEEGSAALGTVIRPGTVKELGHRAGLNGFEVVDVDAGFFRLYRLTKD